MIPVSMGKDDVTLLDPLFKEPVPKPPYPRAGINNDELILIASELQTGRIPAVFDILLP